jgi:hypothetical protein
VLVPVGSVIALKRTMVDLSMVSDKKEEETV